MTAPLESSFTFVAYSRRSVTRRPHRSGRGAIFILLVLTAAIFLFPFFYVVSAGLQTTQQRQGLPITYWPAHPQWGNFAVGWHQDPFTSYLLHSALIVGVATAASVGSASLVAYGLSRLRFRGRDIWFIAVLATMMLPGTVTLIPIYLMFVHIGWLNTFYPLTVPAFFGGGAFNIFLLRQFMMSLPRELDEAAIADGAGHLRIYWSIILPTIKPALAVVAWTTALINWGDLFSPLIFLPAQNHWTMALGLYSMSTIPIPGWLDQPLMCMAVIMMLPVIIGFFFVQRWLIEGINLTGVAR